MRATVEVRDGRPVVVRTGSGDHGAEIRREARALAEIAGPGTPPVIEFTDDGLDVRLVVGVAPPLSLSGSPLPVVLDALACVADVLGRATLAGIGHGPIRDGDVLGDGTSVMLTGWHRAGDAPEDAVNEFGRFVERLAGEHRDLRTIAARALAPDPPTFAALATALRAALPHEPQAPRQLPVRPLLGTIAVVAVAAVLGLAAIPQHRHAALVLVSPPPRVSVHGNIVERDGGRWVVGRKDDVVVTGAWNCDGHELPAVLRTGAGRVWVFTSWPAGSAPVIGREATDVPGAVRLRVEHDGRCDHLRVVDGDGRATLLR